MTVKDIIAVFSKLKFIKYLRITGGEPFFRNDIEDAVKAIMFQIKPNILHITTNGYFTEKILGLLENLGNPSLHLKISIDGSENVHDEIRGMKGSYRNAVKTLEESIILRKSKGYSVGINYTISEKNIGIDQLRFVHNLSKINHVDMHVDFFYESPPLYKNESKLEIGSEYNFFRNNKGSLSKVFNYCLENKLTKSFAETLKQKYFIYGFENRIMNDKNQPNPKCTALRSHLRILPNADVTVCLYKPQILGNLLRTSFENVWHSEPLGKIRKEVENCRGCWAGCETGPNSIFTGDLIRAIFY